MILFPQPRSLTLFDGACSFPMKKEYSDLVTFFNLVREGLPGVNVTNAPLLEKEEYRLRVDGQGVEISASTDEGLFRAVTSLQQMLIRTGGQLQCMEIKDRPGWHFEVDA